MPFAGWLKNYFKQHKKFGSTDRKAISTLCFSYYRASPVLRQRPHCDAILSGVLFCKTNDRSFAALLENKWKELELLLHSINPIPAPSSINFFPFTEELSEEIDGEVFALSHLIQPDVFLRMQPGRRNVVQDKLKAAGIAFTVEENCVRIGSNTKIDAIIELDKDAVVQDKNSQQVLNSLKKASLPKLFMAWDCCAASGGKSILLHDYFPGAKLTVSDVRESILHNLKNRFKRAGIHQYNSFIADISSPQFSLKKKFDFIICDAPCSGSGTWSRTPEQLSFFKKEKIESYVALQKAIAVNAIRCLEKGGYFLYITCSVFKKENEDVVDYLLQETGMTLIEQKYYKGYADKADTLFTALFTTS